MVVGRVPTTGQIINVAGPLNLHKSKRKSIRVNISRQSLEAYENDKFVYSFDCVTGTSDHPTEPGTFSVFKKDRIHRSHKYDAQMNYAMFFSSDGKAIHQYHGSFSLARLGHAVSSDLFGSHGCVRLAEADVRALFDWAEIGTKVIIT